MIEQEEVSPYALPSQAYDEYFTSKTTVVNKSFEGCDVYIGRPSMFGNPFKMNNNTTREEAISLFKEYFYKRLEEDENFKAAVLDLKGKVLGCFCKPSPCHGDVIVEYLEG